MLSTHGIVTYVPDVTEDSWVTYIFFFCKFRKYCPSVITMDENHLIGRPRSQLSLMLKSKTRTPSTSSSQAVPTDPSWLYPILLPSIFPTLFAIYKEHHAEGDDKLRTQMETLNALPDKELCSLLGLRRLVKFDQPHSCQVDIITMCIEKPESYGLRVGLPRHG